MEMQNDFCINSSGFLAGNFQKTSSYGQAIIGTFSRSICMNERLVCIRAFCINFVMVVSFMP